MRDMLPQDDLWDVSPLPPSALPRASALLTAFVTASGHACGAG